MNTEGEDLFHVSQAHRHPALPVTYSNQCFVVPFHIPILDFFLFSHLFLFFLGEVYRDVFERIFGLRKIIDFINDLLICQTLDWAFSSTFCVGSSLKLLDGLCETGMKTFLPDCVLLN